MKYSYYPNSAAPFISVSLSFLCNNGFATGKKAGNVGKKARKEVFEGTERVNVYAETISEGAEIESVTTEMISLVTEKANAYAEMISLDAEMNSAGTETVNRIYGNDFRGHRRGKRVHGNGN